jgi:magnesium transporter
VVFETNLELFEKYDEVQTDIDQTNQFSDIYRGVLANSLDAFASVINNNFTSVMKIVGSLTLIVAIPTMFASFYGMNVVIPGDVNTGNPYTFFIIILISTILSFFAYRIFKKRNWI